MKEQTILMFSTINKEM